MDKKEFDEKTYTDHNGYFRWKNSDKAIHRQIAKNEIFLKERKKYPFEFNDYQVHHIDGNKKNNRVENLALKTAREHEAEHNIVRYEIPVIDTLLVFLLIGSSWFAYLGFTSGYILNSQDILFMSSTIIIGWILLYLVNRKKKGVRYR